MQAELRPAIHPDDLAVCSLLWDCEREAFRGPEDVSVSEWCNRHVVLLPEYSVNYSGPYRWEMMPFCRDIMDIALRDEVRHIVLKFATQVGKTTILYNLIAYHIDQDPASSMLLYPSDDACKEISRSRLQPHFEACEPVRARIPADRRLWQLQEMHFPGMVLYLVSASGVTGMAQKPIKRLYRDEVNKYPRSIGEHGNPMDLSQERLKASWGDRLIVDVSSPTEPGGAITVEESKCQVVLSYYVPCPHCRRLQTLEWIRHNDDDDEPEVVRDPGEELNPAADDGEAGGEVKRGMVVFDDRPELPRDERIEHAKKAARYVCRFCAGTIRDHHKRWMLSPENGAGWYDMKIDEPTPSENPIQDIFERFHDRGSRLESVAFRLSSLYSPWITFGDVVEKFLDAHLAVTDRYDKLRTFTNDWLGLEWRDVVVERAEHEILRLCGEWPRQVVPPDAVALTLGVDNQKRCKYYTVWAWGRDETSWLIEYGTLFKFDELTELVFHHNWKMDGSGRLFNVWRGALDTGGGDLGDEEQDFTMTQEAYEWLSRWGGNVIYGYKGSSRPMAEKMRGSVIGTYPGSKKPIPGAGVRLWNVDPNYFKDLLNSRMALPAGSPGCVYLHAGTGPDFASHLASEKKQRDKKGHMRWVRVGGQNHYLDCTIMASFVVDPICLGGLRALFPPDVPAVQVSASDSRRGSPDPALPPRDPRSGSRRLW